MTPLVSVVLPTRDRRHALERALASIDAQRFRDFEVVVVDDGSRDGTAAWLRANRPLVSVVDCGQSGGAAAARNQGVARARGESSRFSMTTTSGARTIFRRKSRSWRRTRKPIWLPQATSRSMRPAARIARICARFTNTPNRWSTFSRNARSTRSRWWPAGERRSIASARLTRACPSSTIWTGISASLQREGRCGIALRRWWSARYQEAW